jgi:hypothetical protein
LFVRRRVHPVLCAQQSPEQGRVEAGCCFHVFRVGDAAEREQG